MRGLFLYFFYFFPLFSLPTLEELSLEEKVGQLLLVHVSGEQFNEEAHILLSQIHVGGIIYYRFANSLCCPGQIKKLSSSLQKHSKIPLFIAVDQEGGSVASLQKGFTYLPSQREQASLDIYSLIKRVGNELKEVGININFSPVVDIDNHNFIGIRAFSTIPSEVIRCAKEVIYAYKDSGIICCLKHFPGHGASREDSHFRMPTIYKTLIEMQNEDLLPFQALHDQVDLIMTGHLLVPALDPEFPATLSHTILTSFLRENWGYQGVIISDSLIMNALSSYGQLPELTLQAILAGCDIACISGKINDIVPTLEDYREVYRYLLDAAKTGQLPEERLNDAVTKILDLKRKYCL